MAQQAVAKQSDEAIITGTKCQSFRTIIGAAEQRVAIAPTGADFKAGASVVIPATQVIVAAAVAQIASCVVTDDEGNVFTDAYDIVEWSVDNVANGTVNENGVVTKIGASDVTVTATVLGVTDTCVVSVT